MRARTIAVRTTIVAAIAAVLTWLAIAPQFRSTAHAAVLVPTNQDYADGLHRVHLGPEQLAAAGLSTDDVSTALDDVWSHLVNQPDALAQADAAVTSAEAEFRPLQELVHTGQATSQQLADFQAAQTDYSNALAQRDAALDAIFNAGITDLTENQQLRLTNLRAHASWRMPLEFMVIDRSEPAWVDLREALAAERYALKHEEEVDSGAAAILSAERSQNEVALADANLDSNLDTITAAWNTIVASQ